MKFNRLLFLLQVSTLRIKDKEPGLLLTPSTKEDVVNLVTFQKRMEKYPNGTKMPNLATQIHSLLPTPLAQSREQTNTEAYDKRMQRLIDKGHTPFTMPLDQMAIRNLLPTPTTRDANGIENSPSQKGKSRLAADFGDGTTSQLNPHFVEEMMGFPIDWTELPFLNGETNQSKPMETQ
jgi:hypothetical protein